MARINIGSVVNNRRVTQQLPNGPNGGFRYRMECIKCGRVADAAASDLRKGYGCRSCSAVKHGHAKKGEHSKEYVAYRHMIQRCHNPNSRSYPDYGGRGIYVCQRWRDSFELFASDMGDHPGDGSSIGRIDNNGPYAPGNCRWETKAQQAKNTRATRWVTIDGESKPLCDWLRESGVTLGAFQHRLKKGLTEAEAIKTPKLRQGQRLHNHKVSQ